LTPSAEAQLDKEYQQQIQKQQEQERSNKIREAKCKKLWDLAQYQGINKEIPGKRLFLALKLSLLTKFLLNINDIILMLINKYKKLKTQTDAIILLLAP